MTNSGDKFNPFEVGTSTYDISDDPTMTGNYYEGGYIPSNQKGGRPLDVISSMPLRQIATQELDYSPIKATPFTGGTTGNGTLLSRLTDNKMALGASKLMGKMKGMGSVPMAGIIQGAAGIAQGLIGRKKRRAEQKLARKEYQQMKDKYRALDTSNLAANLQNQFAENVFEDLTVNTQQADFMAQQQQQSQANIMQSLQGAAGGSGIAGLAQALANQSTQAMAKASASIGMQEAQNQKLAAQGQLQVQKGQAMVDQQVLAGEERARGLDYRQTGTLLGMAQRREASANKAIADANAALYGGIGSIAGSLLTGGLK